jgi:hypothetical protein
MESNLSRIIRSSVAAALLIWAVSAAPAAAAQKHQRAWSERHFGFAYALRGFGADFPLLLGIGY